MKKILIFISVLFNVVIIAVFIYLSLNSSLSASNDEDVEQPIQSEINFDNSSVILNQ